MATIYKYCIFCGDPVVMEPKEYHWCLYPKEGPAHKACAARRPVVKTPREMGFKESKDAQFQIDMLTGKRVIDE